MACIITISWYTMPTGTGNLDAIPYALPAKESVFIP